MSQLTHFDERLLRFIKLFTLIDSCDKALYSFYVDKLEQNGF